MSKWIEIGIALVAGLVMAPKSYISSLPISSTCQQKSLPICQLRWQINLLFHWINQNLVIKIIFGTSNNAVTQI